MGGNATKEFNTVRMTKEQYYKLSIMLLTSVVSQANSNERNGIPVSYGDKDSFGDIDFLSTITSDEFEKRITNGLYSDKLDILGKKKNGNITSYAIRYKDDNGEWSEPFQVDLIKTNSNEFDFSYNYFSYNDLGNFIGRLAVIANLKFGFDGLFVKTYFDNHSDVTERKQNSVGYMETKFDVDFYQALELLGLSVERYKQGFKTLDEIFEFIAQGEYFNYEFFKVENLNSSQRQRDVKRPNFIKSLEYFEKSEPKHSAETARELLNESVLKQYNIQTIRVQHRKEYKRKYYKNKRLSVNKLRHLFPNLSDREIGTFVAYLKTVDDFYNWNELMNRPKQEFHQTIMYYYDDYKNQN